MQFNVQIQVNYEANQFSLLIINKTWFFFFFFLKAQMFRNNSKNRDVIPGDSLWWHREELRLNPVGLAFPKYLGYQPRFPKCASLENIFYIL